MSFKDKFTSESVQRGIIVASFCLILLFLLSFVVDEVIMPSFVGLGDEKVVPDVSDINIEVAKQTLEEQGFGWRISSEEFSPTHPPLTVIKQQPLAGLVVKSGRIVELVISKGSEFSVVEDLRGFTLRQAKLRLMEDGFEVGLITYDFDESLPPEVVIRTYPAAMAEVERGTPVDLVVNIRKGTELVLVPDFIGLDFGSVKEELSEHGLVLGDVDYVEDETVLPETILSQSLVPGMEVLQDTEISFTVSRIPEEM
ncbi:MAG: PASTA domain-containing protein [candidate division Zixibacteria bacterium]|nr:PASTA domain-containing protein [candidate division Zixibacteria bacterium]